MQKIILTGPESSGKTTLAQQIAAHFQTGWLPEYAREYLQNLDRPYEESDLFEIAKGQSLQEEKALEKAALTDEKRVICDTSFLVLKIWSIVKYDRCHPFILKKLERQTNIFYILCGPEIPWEYDPQREHSNDREKLYHVYRKELEKMEAHFIEVAGSKEERLKACLEAALTINP
ncbi:MAG: NadR type nicotinamide-nucleotide adenylyltransferase [Paraglaciecola sp.]|jgi:NadR type nicotinamide-nucleotide adenylyltransferase